MNAHLALRQSRRKKGQCAIKIARQTLISRRRRRLHVLAALVLAVIVHARDALPAAERSPAVRVYAYVSPAVVGVTCRAPGTGGSEFSFFGTGTVVSPEGLVLTSTTVVPGKARRIRVYLQGGQVVSAKLIETKSATEFSLLRVERSGEGGGDLPYLSLGNSTAIALGAPVYTLGNAFECIQKDDQAAMSAGVISGLFSLRETQGESTYIGRVIETSAPVNNGMDGGPLVSARGELLGVITLNYSPNRWLAAAVPVDILKPSLLAASGDKRFDQESKNDSLSYLGVELAAEEKLGVRVTRIVPDSPASRAGLEPGDVIQQADDRRVTSTQEFRTIFGGKKPGDKLTLKLKRNEEERSMEIQLWGRY